MPHELINRFEMDPVIGRFYRSARLTAEIVQRSHQVLAQSRQLLRNNLDGATARDREMQREAELQRLAVADRQIADAERAVTKQTVELEKLRRDGLDTHLAEHTLQHFEALLQAMHKHREEIVRTIAHIDQGLV